MLTKIRQNETHRYNLHNRFRQSENFVQIHILNGKGLIKTVFSRKLKEYFTLLTLS
jgi:hypothetical protein